VAICSDTKTFDDEIATALLTHKAMSKASPMTINDKNVQVSDTTDDAMKY